MIPVSSRSRAAAATTRYWWALALGACFGGNATLIARRRQRSPPRTADAEGERIFVLAALVVFCSITSFHGLTVHARYRVDRYSAR